MQRNERPTLLRDLRLLVFLALGGAVLFLLLLDERAKLRAYRAKIASFEEKLLAAKEIIREHRDVLLPKPRHISSPTLLAEKSLRTVITETLEKLGIVRNVESIDPRQDAKKGILSARVSLRNMPLRRIVDFIVALKSLGAGIVDREALMRMEGYNRDLWRLDLVLEAPWPKRAILQQGKKESQYGRAGLR